MTDNDAEPVPPGPALTRPSTAASPFSSGAGAGVGSLPHRDATAAVAFAISEFEIASIPSLPNLLGRHAVTHAGRPTGHPRGRCSSIAQAVAGVPGVAIERGRITTDAGFLGADGAITTALEHGSFAGMRAFLDLAAKIRLDGAPVTWQYGGPVTLGVALHEAGLDVETAFDLAVRIVRTQLTDVAAAITDVLPASPQLVMLDEPALSGLMSADFPIPPDQAVDMMSSGMAALSSTAIVGIHSDLPCDLATMLNSGPGVISVPVHPDLADWAGYLDRFLEEGGVVAWGVVPTEGPVAITAERHWRALSDLWCELVRRGCDPVALRRQAMVTPGGGLDAHAVSVARRIARMTADVGKRVKDQANATRFALGA